MGFTGLSLLRVWFGILEALTGHSGVWGTMAIELPTLRHIAPQPAQKGWRGGWVLAAGAATDWGSGRKTENSGWDTRPLRLDLFRWPWPVLVLQA
ncbi:hypothetical protein ASC97_28100 [Rhizobium sp. Root1203]|nr:hypothetical protein ASC97_28100 [Rhizobium sp. Root1203]